MTPRTFVRSLAVGLAATMLGTGCSPDRAVAPSSDAPIPAAAVNSIYTVTAAQPGTTVEVVQRTQPLAADVSVTQTIGPRGGILFIKEAGLLVYFSPGAVAEPTTITATANAGSLISYSFEPHGLRFAAPVYVAQTLGLTTLSRDPGAASGIAGAYTPNGLSDIDTATGTAQVSELHAAYTSTSRQPGGITILDQSIFTIQHFSGYILTTGRKGE